MPAEVPIPFASQHSSSVPVTTGLASIVRCGLRIPQAWRRKYSSWRMACLIGVLATLWNTAIVAGERIDQLAAADAFVPDYLDKSHNHCPEDGDTELEEPPDVARCLVTNVVPWISMRSVASTATPAWWYYIRHALELPPPIL
jgi:hypothetical protein